MRFHVRRGMLVTWSRVEHAALSAKRLRLGKSYGVVSSAAKERVDSWAKVTTFSLLNTKGT